MPAAEMVYFPSAPGCGVESDAEAAPAKAARSTTEDRILSSRYLDVSERMKGPDLLESSIAVKESTR
jgi:hypothetical protein